MASGVQGTAKIICSHYSSSYVIADAIVETETEHKDKYKVCHAWCKEVPKRCNGFT